MIKFESITSQEDRRGAGTSTNKRKLKFSDVNKKKKKKIKKSKLRERGYGPWGTEARPGPITI